MKNGSSLKKILISAGPTVEALDPVRYLSNRSTGTMGYEIAAESAERGFEVVLVSGPVRLAPPEGVTIKNVVSAAEMQKAVEQESRNCDCLIMAAAVCDFRPETQSGGKIKKKDTLELKLVKNPDILEGIKTRDDLIKVGFALETDDPSWNAGKKLKDKHLDMVVLNTISDHSDPFGTDAGARDYSFIDKSENLEEKKGFTKERLAKAIIDKIEEIWAEKGSQ
ncbi:MAG: phosphopantothenoylcysteine decarboxylase [Candidatus Tantalella remota]|nr:phosphopantothenoylcysteine decarboxylase [Candidatus Tantalella remota]